MIKRILPVLCLMLASCTPQIAMQTIPVSTDPGGAKVAVDGKDGCTAPCQVDLARNQDHILTITKDGYRQQDVVIKRQYQTGKVMINAINDGAQSGKFFNDAWWGANAAVMSMNSQESTGDAYVLTPSTVSLRLVPVNGFPARTSHEEAQKTVTSQLSPLDVMDLTDQQMLENALSNVQTGQTTAWTNPQTGVVFSMQPEAATQTANGNVERWFTLGAKKGDQTASGRYPAYRVGRGEWALDAASDVAKTNPDVDAGADAITKQETLRALGQSMWPSVGKSWDAGSSSHTHTSTSTTTTPTGYSSSSTTTTTKTSAKVGVSANPGALVNVLDALIGE